MADQGFMGAGALPPQAQKHLGYGQMKDGAIARVTGKERTPEELKKLKEQQKKKEAEREAKRAKNKERAGKKDEVENEEGKENEENIDDRQADLENEVNKTEDLEKLHPFKLKKLAKDKGYTGKKFDKDTLIKFLRSNQ